MPDFQTVAHAIDRVETELKRIGWWREDPLPPEMYQFTQAFAMDTMPFACWLQFILIPRVRDIIGTGGEFPASSMVAAQAVREFDGVDEAHGLVSALSDFDALFR
ncbi:MAG TPA: YqcC family protein [Gemmatimonadales bacterium]|nr:YqcC family protein [Gemmatimonadales bacterium]